MDRRRRARMAACLAALATLALGGCDAGGQLDPALLLSAGTITAENIAFSPTAITIRAGAPITVTLDNADEGVPHGLKVSQGGAEIAATEIIAGPAKTTLELPPLAAGVYEFSCPVHPNMVGTFTATP